jgi:RNA polymerase primary sigma factor
MTEPAREKAAGEAELIAALLAGEAAGWERFVRRVQSDVYTACCLAFPSVEDADRAFTEIFRQFQANDFAVLRAFDAGRGSLSSYLRLVLRDILAKHVVALFVDDHNRGWHAIEHFFRRDIVQSITRHLPDQAGGSGKPTHDEEAYQEVCLRLIEDGYRRIRAYDGHGSFGGFMLRTVNNLCVDLRRERSGRRRLPAGISRLPDLEQEVYRQLYWKNCPPDQLAATLAQGGLSNSTTDIARAVAAVRSARRKDHVNGVGAADPVISLSQPDPEQRNKLIEIEDELPNPEESLFIQDAQAALDKASARLRVALDTLPADMQVYVKLRFWDELPPRDVARVMNLSNTEIYRLRAKTERMLGLALSADEDVEKWRQAV